MSTTIRCSNDELPPISDQEKLILYRPYIINCLICQELHPSFCKINSLCLTCQKKTNKLIQDRFKNEK